MIGIPPDISYGLQCGVEGFDITEDVITFYYAFNDVDLAKLSDEYEHSQNHESIRHSLQEFARKVYYEPYREWFHARANQDQQVWCVARAGDSFGRKSAEMIDYKLSHYISDMLADDLDPYDRDLQDTWLSRNIGFRHHETITSELINKIGSLPVDQLLHAIHNPNDFSLRFPKPEPLVILPDDMDYSEPYIDGRYLPHTSASTRVEKKRRRKVLKKSAQFLNSLVGRETASLFIGGSKIEIEGKRFIFSVKVDSLYSQNHGALDISVLEKSTKEYLCKLCWYVEETPALDQVSALVLAVQADCEDSIIKIGNAFSVRHEAIARHTHIHDLIKPRSTDMIDGLFMPDIDPDVMLQLTRGTTAFREQNPDLYRMFSQTCSDRLVRNVPLELMTKFTPLPPTSVRAFLADGTVSNELVFD